MVRKQSTTTTGKTKAAVPVLGILLGCSLVGNVVLLTQRVKPEVEDSAAVDSQVPRTTPPPVRPSAGETASGEDARNFDKALADWKKSPVDISSHEKLLRTWARKDLKGALAFITGSLEGVERVDALAMVVGAWAESAPAEAARWYDDAPEAFQNEDTAQAIIVAWAESDPAAASRWVGRIADADTRTSVSEGLAAAWAQKDGAAAVDWASRAGGAGQDIGGAFQIAYEAWIEADPAAARKRVDTFSDPEISMDAHRLYGSMMAVTDPDAAWEFATGISGNTIRRETTYAVMEELADKQPSQAATKLLAEQDETARTELTRILVSKWIHTDPEASAAWVEGLPAGSGKEMAYQTVSDQLADSKPSAALGWAMKIEDHGQRLQTLENAFSSLAHKDPAAADAWLIRGDLAEDIKAMGERVKSEAGGN